MKRPRPSPAGPVKELRRRTQRTTSSTAQPDWVMVELRTMHTELFMRVAVSQRLCAIKCKFGVFLSAEALPRLGLASMTASGHLRPNDSRR
jgi:hypothetical protein